jgi:hypothetical protein
MEQLDKKGEMTMLSPQELDVKHCLKIRLMQLLREEEIKWYQRSKANNLEIVTPNIFIWLQMVK